MDRLRIGFISSWAARCGIAEHTRFLAESLVKLGHKIIVLGNYSLPDSISERLPVPYTPFFYTGWHQERGVDVELALQTIQKNEINILHWQFQNFLYPEPFFQALKKMAQEVPVVVTFHDPLIPQGFPLESCLGGVFHHETTARMLSWSKKKLIAPIGIQHWADRPREEVRRTIGISSRHVICSIGLSRTDHEIVLKVLAQMKEYPDLIYIATMPVPTAQRIQRLAKELKLEKRVIIDSSFPSINLLQDYLQAADISLFYYPEYGVEGSCSAAARLGLAALRPVILTDVKLMQGLPEQLKIPYGEPEILRERIKRIFTDDDYRGQLLVLQQGLFAEENWERVAQKHLEFYQEIIINNKK